MENEIIEIIKEFLIDNDVTITHIDDIVGVKIDINEDGGDPNFYFMYKILNSDMWYDWYISKSYINKELRKRKIKCLLKK